VIKHHSNKTRPRLNPQDLGLTKNIVDWILNGFMKDCKADILSKRIQQQSTRKISAYTVTKESLDFKILFENVTVEWRKASNLSRFLSV
jgi:hypothetical protein